MFLGVRTKYWYFLVAAVLLIAGMIFIQISSVFALQNCEVSGPLAERLPELTADSSLYGHNVFWADTDEFAQKLLAFDQIENVTLHLSLPSGIHAEINRFEPKALALADKLYGIDYTCRIIPYDTAWETKNLPVFTGLEKIKLFSVPKDYRVAEALNGLLVICSEFPELFNQIAELDFSDKVYIQVFLTTGNNVYLAKSQDFANQLCKLRAVRDVVASGDGATFNLSYDDVVIKQ
ncbi:MAG: hypothetical protein R3F48_15720 [Candidatus Zixiibacteriota bacterium]